MFLKKILIKYKKFAYIDGIDKKIGEFIEHFSGLQMDVPSEHSSREW
jgi:hypothetical protein